MLVHCSLGYYLLIELIGTLFGGIASRNRWCLIARRFRVLRMLVSASIALIEVVG